MDSSVDWQKANQNYLMESLARVRGIIEAYISDSESGNSCLAMPHEVGSQGSRQENASAISAPSSLEFLSQSFSLSLFEIDLLLLCAGIELDSSFVRLCAKVQGDPGKPYPTFSLALESLPNPHWTAIVPGAPLRRWRMIEVGPGSALTTSPLRIDERILHYLAGVSCLDERLKGLVEPVAIQQEDLPAYLKDIADRIEDIWSGKEGRFDRSIIQLCGGEDIDDLAIAASACRAMGMELFSIKTHDIPGPAQERDALACLWDREAILSGSVLFVDAKYADSAEINQNLLSFVENLHSKVIITSREPISFKKRLSVRFDVREIGMRERLAIWKGSLGSSIQDLDGDLEAIASQFNLGLYGIRSVCIEAEVAATTSKGQKGAKGRLWDACRSQARPKMEGLAQLIEPSAAWDDLVLPQPQIQILREIAIHVRHKAKVYETWGFEHKGSRGLGISALFSGSSGTGKTMAAEVLAGELRLDIYRVDLSRVVSKYIGETEKNLRKIFDAAEGSGAILLFDEADALFGKRSEVRDSHDRYANIEISYLLQRMEAYRGLAILTTNMKNSLDQAFLRRIRFIVQFSFPDAFQRAEIWRRIFPKETPTESLDLARLSRLDVAGGSIRNIALYAAFLAADEDRPVGMRHLLRAARVEYAKLEKPLNESEMRG
ncbi:MAG: ATP-binding protein [Methanotrichaceae archaeon]